MSNPDLTPERIWADQDNLTWVEADPSERMKDHETVYVRADLTTPPEDVYVVWSIEHSAWWGPEERGYYAYLSSAGRYTQEQAVKIATRARGGKAFNNNPTEVPVLLADAEVFWPDMSREERLRARGAA